MYARQAGGVQGPAGEGAGLGSDHRKSGPYPWDDHGFRPKTMDFRIVGQLQREREGTERDENIPTR